MRSKSELSSRILSSLVYKRTTHTLWYNLKKIAFSLDL
nr:MAG TPA: hypothetical protein [Microviridae sp.]